MTKIIFLIFGFIFLMGLSACEIKTPEIHGIVLDAETKQPVEGAWISATIGIKTKTVAGDVGQMISLDPPHTRTNKDGKFLIPPKKIKKSPFPVSFGTEIDSVGIGANTIDDKQGGVILTGDELKGFLEKEIFKVEIKIKYVPRTEEEYFSHLQSLFNYCFTGRFGIEVPPVEGGCDEWELEYIIVKHRRYLEKYKELAGRGEIKGFFAVIDQLAELYEKKSDFKEAIDVLMLKTEIIEKRGLLRFEDWQKIKDKIDRKIHELKKRLERIQK